MCVVEPRGDTTQVFQRGLLIQRALLQLSREVAARDVLHDHVWRPLVVAEIEDVDDVRMAHLSDGLRFVVEASDSVRADGDSLQDLDRTRALELGVIRAINDAHSPLAYELLDLVGAQLRPCLDRHRLRLWSP